MTPRDPSDSAERLAVATRIDLSHFVEAGAGTGKTHTLLGRIVELVTARDGVPMRSIAAITFTERAAEELRGRIREGLKGLKGLEGAQKALLEVDEAAIGTIHSFARRILAEHGLAIGVPPGFAVAATSAAAQGNDETWYRVHEAWQADAVCRGHLAGLAALGIRESALHGPVFEMLSVRSRIAPAVLDSAGESLTTAAAELAAFIRRRRATASVDCTNRDDKLYLAIWGEWFDDLLAHADTVAAGTAPAGAARHIALAPKNLKLGGVGAKANWGGRAPKEIRDELKEDVALMCAAVASAATEGPVRSLLRVALSLMDQARAQRIRDGELQFDDLLVLCRELLAQRPDIASKVSQAHRVVMVDEFQDTDPLQWEIVRLITSAGSSDGQPRPGALVLVGDPKQSIYGFRGADITTYERVRDQFTGESIRELRVNFRTVGPVVEWINSLFAPMFDADASQVRYEPLSAHHDPRHEKPGPPVLLLQPPEDDTEAREAPFVVAAIARVLGEGWQVTGQDAASGDRIYRRRASFRDIAVLVPVRTTVGLLLNEFDAVGIPYRSNDVSIVFDRPITRGLISALRAIAREDSELDLWGTLKSPLFGLDDELLLQHARATGSSRWRVRRPRRSGENEVPTSGGAPRSPDAADEALSLLAEAREVARAGRPAEVVNFLVDRCDVPAVIAAQPRAAFEAECLRYLVDQAQAWEDAGGVGVEAFVSWLATASGDLKSGLGVSDDRLADAVQISTVHGAKGLEFPVVIVAGMSSPPQNTLPQLLVGHGGEVEFQVSGNPPPGPLPVGKLAPGQVSWPSSGYRELAEQRKAEEEAELKRLLYVAMTRAQDHLVVSMVGSKRGRSARVKDYLPDAEVMQEAPDSHQLGLPAAGPARAVQEPAARDLVERAARVASRATLLRPSMESGLVGRLGIEVLTPQWDSAAQAGPGPEPGPSAPDVGEVPEARKPGGLAGTAMGNAVHEALERAVLDGPQADVSQISRRAADSHNVDRAQAERRVRAALESPTVREAMASRCWPELVFTYGVESGTGDGIDVVDGVADLVFETGDGLVVADYKTDAAPSDTTKRHYAEQLATYARILTDLTGMEVARKVVVWLPPSGPARDIEV